MSQFENAMMEKSLLWVLLLSLCGTALGQLIGCPTGLGWVGHSLTCYKFSSFPSANYKDAVSHCQEDGATLLSVNNEGEHRFIKTWLLSNDQRRDGWWTSGRTDDGKLLWEGDGSTALYRDGWLNPPSDYRKGVKNVMYYYNKGEFGWTIADRVSPMSFICEIGIQEVYRISQEHRGFDYGINVQDPSEAPRGPFFVVQPESVTILRDTTLVFFDCVAGGNPDVTYQWLKRNKDKVMVPVVLNDRLTTVTGRLNIINPRENYRDGGVYQCKVSNTFGTILSSPVDLSFGSIGDFSTVAPSDVEAHEQNGAQLVCPQIQGTPGLTYQWYKNSPNSFIRPNAQKQHFLSASGKLLFSEVAPTDNGTYYCVASVTAYGLSRNYLGSSSGVSRLSKGFKMDVKKSSGNEYSVQIQKDFIYVFPPTPMRGSDLRLECFAYGSLPLAYTWGRVNRPFPEGRHEFKSQNRILMLKEVEIEDQGTYFCNVSSSKTMSKQSTSLALEILSDPYFIYPLKHQHVDSGSFLTWHCEALGNPFPVYTWYKNGVKMTSASGVSVIGNTLTITSLNSERDNGMYQCGAENNYGVKFTTAQLRILKIKPSFEKNPMIKSVTGALGGQVTIKCDPIGAPRPVFTWYKDNADLNLVAGRYQPDDHYRLLLSGDLMIQDIQRNDVGRYKCSVTNDEGSDEDYTNLNVNERAQFYEKPQNADVEVNSTITLLCQASHPNNIDVVYIWSFNDHIIDFEREPEYRLGQGKEEGYLYVISAQFRNEGYYTCSIVSASDHQEARAFLKVLGPPGEPAGVQVHDQPMAGMSNQFEGVKLDTTRWLTWVDGDTHGDSITHFFIEFRSNFDPSWRTHHDGNGISEASTNVEGKPGLRYARVTRLKAGASIEFRVKARNGFGVGAPSLPTTVTTIKSSAPSATVTNIRGGGGSVGDLTIWWDPLPREDHNGPELEYKVEWRVHEEGGRGDKWQHAFISHNKACRTSINIELGLMYVCQYVKLVGEDNYYIEYDARVMAKNEEGDGPTSEPVIVMSAETLPQATPANVRAEEFNATALMVYWDPVDNVRESAGGTLKGYKINYWRPTIDTESEALQNIIELKEGQKNLDSGMIIGLTPQTWYEFNVQAYNSAGNGLKSSDNEQETLNRVPQKFPTEVYIYSIDGKGVRVNFRGVSSQAGEEPLQGYKVQVWKSNENIRSAMEYDFGKANSGTIRKLNSSVLYQLRVFAYSRAGQGERSSPTVFFTVGDGQILWNPETTSIMAGGSTVKSSLIFTVMFVITSAILSLHS